MRPRPACPPELLLPPACPSQSTGHLASRRVDVDKHGYR